MFSEQINQFTINDFYDILCYDIKNIKYIPPKKQTIQMINKIINNLISYKINDYYYPVLDISNLNLELLKSDNYNNLIKLVKLDINYIYVIPIEFQTEEMIKYFLKSLESNKIILELKKINQKFLTKNFYDKLIDIKINYLFLLPKNYFTEEILLNNLEKYLIKNNNYCETYNKFDSLLWKIRQISELTQNIYDLLFNINNSAIIYIPKNFQTEYMIKKIISNTECNFSIHQLKSELLEQDFYNKYFNCNLNILSIPSHFQTYIMIMTLIEKNLLTYSMLQKLNPKFINQDIYNSVFKINKKLSYIPFDFQTKEMLDKIISFNGLNYSNDKHGELLYVSPHLLTPETIILIIKQDEINIPLLIKHKNFGELELSDEIMTIIIQYNNGSLIKDIISKIKDKNYNFNKLDLSEEIRKKISDN